MGTGLEQGRADGPGAGPAKGTALSPLPFPGNKALLHRQGSESWQVSAALTDNKLLSMQTTGRSQKQHSFSEICLPFLLSHLSLSSIVFTVAALGFGGLVSQPAELSPSP